MTCQTSAGDVFACLLLAIGLFAGSLIPFFLLVEAEHLTPGWVRELPAKAREMRRDAALSAAALLLILTAPKGATS
ncbi:hypothetical protein ACFXKC_28260 [Streptomyces sp. NPDC059340]|uniref:hypothetical protein n=1 Tax=Streptomyces sp. NPDC059340 TaxID=3346806 RepID=UPI0036A2A666